MKVQRLSILVAAGVVVTGCGASAGVTATGQQTVTAVHLSSRTGAPALAQPTPAVTVAPTSAPTPRPAPPRPQVIVVADENGAAPFAITLVSSAGGVIASTHVAEDARWTVGSGGGAAYWVTAGRLQRLTTNGIVTTLGDVPANQFGRVVISPDGSQWAYGTSVQNAAGVITNRLYRGGSGLQTRLVAQRTSDFHHPTADAPPAWEYYPLSWTALGILIERQPTGGCGCGTPFDMQMTAGYAAFINPITGAATPLAAAPTCPVSGVAVDGTLACFHVTSKGTSDGLRFVGPERTVQYALSGRNDGGDAAFNGTTLAYATVPGTAGGCGGPDWRPVTTLHVMDIATGDARVVGRVGVQPVVWLANGSILAYLSLPSVTQTLSSVVAVDPSTGATRTLVGGSYTIVGVA